MNMLHQNKEVKKEENGIPRESEGRSEDDSYRSIEEPYLKDCH